MQIRTCGYTHTPTHVHSARTVCVQSGFVDDIEDSISFSFLHQKVKNNQRRFFLDDAFNYADNGTVS